MEPAVVVGLLWLVFGGLHIGLTSARVRSRLVASLGEWGFLALFSAVAGASFIVLVAYYATHRFLGAPGPDLAAIPALRVLLAALIVIGVVLVPVSLRAYPGSADAVMRTDGIRPPRGIYRITRHPFFVAMVLIAIGHGLLASHLVGTVFFAGLFLLSTLGPAHQRRKLVASRGKAYADHLASTSAIPFAAILAGRQRLEWRELDVLPFALGILLAWFLRSFHDEILAHGGAWVSLVFVGGAGLQLARAWYRDRRARRSEWWVSQSRHAFGNGENERSSRAQRLSSPVAALPLRRVPACCGGVLVAYVALCHEVVGPTLFPHADAFFGGWLAFHLVGVAGVVLGALTIAGALGVVRVPLASLGLVAGVAGGFFVLIEAVSRHGFHFFAFTMLIAGALVALTAREPEAARP